MSNTKRLKRVNSNIGRHCQTLIDDFFNFVEGNLNDITVIMEYRDISNPMPPDAKQMGTMLRRCNNVWLDYCKFMKLPRELHNLYMNKIKEKWQSLEQKIPIHERKRQQ